MLIRENLRELTRNGDAFCFVNFRDSTDPALRWVRGWVWEQVWRLGVECFFKGAWVVGVSIRVVGACSSKYIISLPVWLNFSNNFLAFGARWRLLVYLDQCAMVVIILSYNLCKLDGGFSLLHS